MVRRWPVRQKIVIPGVAHPVARCGNCREGIFFAQCKTLRSFHSDESCRRMLTGSLRKSEAEMLRHQASKRLAKKAKRGFRGYPIGTVDFYGEDASKATKLAAGVKYSEDEPALMRRWFSTGADVRSDPEIVASVMAFFEENGVLSVTMVDRIIGCPHQEGVDYEGPTCPACPYWAERDRWTGRMIEE